MSYVESTPQHIAGNMGVIVGATKDVVRYLQASGWPSKRHAEFRLMTVTVLLSPLWLLRVAK